jgi:hypothetical protein
MTERKYDAFDNLLYLVMRHFKTHDAPPRKVKLPIDEARMIIRSKHSGIRTLDELMNDGVAGIPVEIDDDPDARIILLG